MFPFWYSNCTVEKVWDPDVADTCIGESNFPILQYTALETKLLLFASIFSHISFNFSITQIDLVRSVLPNHGLEWMSIGLEKVVKEERLCLTYVLIRKYHTLNIYKVITIGYTIKTFQCLNNMGKYIISFKQQVHNKFILQNKLVNVYTTKTLTK